MEVMRMSLHDLIYDPRNNLTDADIKYIMYEVLSGIEILHRNWILHRVCAKREHSSNNLS